MPIRHISDCWHITTASSLYLFFKAHLGIPLTNPTTYIPNHKGIGIRNVNKRLKILYGEDSGLTISNPQDNLTVSEIKIKKIKLS